MIPVYLLLLPALVCGEIVVYVNLALKEPLIDVSGHSEIPIPEKERLAFKLDEKQLKKSVAIYSKATPTDVFVRNGWPDLDLYKTYDWQKVKRIINPTLVTKTNTKYSKVCEPVPPLNQTTTVENMGNCIISTNENIRYEIIYGSNKLNFTSHWGKPINEFQTNQFTEPKSSINKCIALVYLEYEATLSGDVAVNYSGKREGSHFWKYDVNNVQKAAGLPTSVFYQDKLIIEYYT